MCPHILTWRNIFTIELLTRIKLNWSELYQATMSCDQWQWGTRAEHPLWVCLPPVSSVRLPEYYPGHDDNGWPEEQWPAGHHSAPALSRDHRPVLGPSLWWLCRHVMAGHAVIGQSGAGTWDMVCSVTTALRHCLCWLCSVTLITPLCQHHGGSWLHRVSVQSQQIQTQLQD